MPRLVSPLGVVVSVSEEKANDLRRVGYQDGQPPEAPVDLTPAPRKPRKTKGG